MNFSEIGAEALKSIFTITEDGWSLLHEFSSNGRCVDLVQELLQQGFPVDYQVCPTWSRDDVSVYSWILQDKTGWTALHEAAQEGQLNICRLLVENGANPSIAKYEDRITPLMAAAEVGDDKTTEWFLNLPRAWSRKWEPELFKFLLEHSPSCLPFMLDAYAQRSSEHQEVWQSEEKDQDFCN